MKQKEQDLFEQNQSANSQQDPLNQKNSSINYPLDKPDEEDEKEETEDDKMDRYTTDKKNIDKSYWEADGKLPSDNEDDKIF